MNIAIISLGWALLHSLWQGTVIWAALRAALVILAQSPARVRCFVSSIALAATVLSFFFTFFLINVSELKTAPVTIGNSGAALVGREAPSISRTTSHVDFVTDFSNATEALRTVFLWMVLLWVGGCVWGAARVAISWKGTRDLAGRFRTNAPAWLEMRCEKLAHELGIRRVVQIGESLLVAGPSVVGWLKPVILIPVGAFSGLEPVQVDAILAHELAHILRNDFIANLLQSICEVLFFYHPAIWAISREIRIERENACDDIAIELTGDGRAYAAALAELEEGRCPPIVVAARGGNLVARVCRLLVEPAPPKKGIIAVSWLTLVGVGAALSFIIAPSIASRLLAVSPDAMDGLKRSSTDREIEFPYNIDFVTSIPQWGRFSAGDNITITSVRSDRKQIEVGGTYLVEGTYRLRSMKDVNLGLSVTVGSDSAGAISLVDAEQTNHIVKGDGHFSVRETMRYDGSFHVSFSPTDGGESRGTVYFEESRYPDNKSKLGSTRIVIAVAEGGALSVDDKAINDDGLKRLLILARDADSGVQVLIKADENTPLKRLTFVMDSCRSAGLTKFSLQSR